MDTSQDVTIRFVYSHTTDKCALLLEVISRKTWENRVNAGERKKGRRKRDKERIKREDGEKTSGPRSESEVRLASYKFTVLEATSTFLNQKPKKQFGKIKAEDNVQHLIRRGQLHQEFYTVLSWSVFYCCTEKLDTK